MIENTIHVLLLESSIKDYRHIKSELDLSDLSIELTHVVNSAQLDLTLQKRIPDIVLTEFKSKDFDIYNVISALSRKKYRVPVILVTNQLRDSKAVDLIAKTDISDYVLKDKLVRLVPVIKREHETNKVRSELEEKNKELEKLSLVAKHTHTGVVITDEKRRIEWVNDAFSKITGYTFEESIGKSPGEMLQGEKTDPETVSRISKNLQKAAPFSEEILNYNKKGFSYTLKLNITPILNSEGKVEKFIAIQENVTKRIQTEKALLRSNRKLRKAQHIGNIGDWSYDTINKVFDWSSQMYKIYNRDRYLGPPSFEDFIEMTGSKSYRKIKEAVLKTMKSGIPSNIDTEIYAPELKYIHANILSKIGKEGKVVKVSGTVQDITVMKKTEIELKQRSDQIDLIIENLNSIILTYSMHPDGSDDIVYISDGVEKIYGISKADALDDTENIYKNVHPDDLDELMKSIKESYKNFSLWNHSWRQVMEDGSIKHLRGTGKPREQNNGSVIWDMICSDETDIVLKENRKNELENLLQDSVDEIFIFDAKTHKFIFCNDSALENIGYTEAEMKELTPVNIKPEFNKKDFSQILDLTRSRSGYKFETLHKRKNESVYNVLIHLRYEQYQGKDVFIAHTSDISGYVKTKEKLQRIQTYNELAIENAEVGLWELELSSGKTYYNEMYYKMLGYPEEEVVFNKSFYDGIVHPDDSKIVEKHLIDIKSNELDGFEETIRLKNKNGEYRWIFDKSKVIKRNEDGFPTVLAGTHIDVTDLVSTIEEKNILLQEVHHRVKNNLAIVSGLIDLQMMNKENGQDDSLLDTRKRIQAIATVHEQLYNTDNFSEIDLNTYFETLIENISTTLVDNNQLINVDFKCFETSININQAVPLGLLINELIAYTVKYDLSDGQGTIKIRVLEMENDFVSFSYENTGSERNGGKLKFSSSFVSELIQTLIQQLTPDFVLQTEGRFKLQFSFKKKIVGAYSNIRF